MGDSDHKGILDSQEIETTLLWAFFASSGATLFVSLGTWETDHLVKNLKEFQDDL